jgi:ABC-type glycerol-3-phosphate transport system substrate-binding protein
VHLANDPYKQKIRVAIGANKAPDIFFNWGGGILKSYVDAGKVLDLTPYLKADPAWKNKFFGNVLNSAAYNGHYYGIPNVGMQPVVVFYNKKIFAANNLTPPKTWAELLNVVAKLKSTGVTPMVLGGQSKWPDLMWEEYLVDRLGPSASTLSSPARRTPGRTPRSSRPIRRSSSWLTPARSAATSTRSPSMALRRRPCLARARVRWS